jgi:hypothetical protein
MVERNVQFQVNPDNIQIKNDSNDGNDGNDGQDVPNPPQIVQNNAQVPQIVIPVGAPGAAQTTLAFMVEQ